MKNKIVAALLALFLGGIGVHQFYLGNNKKGIFYLLFFWTLIPSMIAFIDFIILLTMNEELFNNKYNSNLTVTQVATQPNIQAEYNDYIRFTKEIDLDYIENNEHSAGSYNEVLKKLIKDYRYLSKEINHSNIKTDPIFKDFKTKEYELNKINQTIGYPQVNYFDYLSSFLSK
ncbi:TM2 domain-containing protein [Empedobacter falsenii]|uniref:TM2 domain-containing protein n=1 Tax=Empedobacter falsenii TaxID=343874 RepID=UPI002576BBDC|nr:TM2 domain-containing protein [Empedobacter falsenii]MDM1548614.1 TM2 domain-containing protein [Empedobacter falsenii]